MGTLETSLATEDREAAVALVEATHARLAVAYPGPWPGRQPVHTVYGGAHLFGAGTPRKLGDAALRTLDAYAPDAATLSEALDREVPATVYGRVRDKLTVEPVEDLRIDFEDGYGNRPGDEEDGHAVAAAAELADGMEEGALPPFVGIRIKPLDRDHAERSVRTLDLFVTTLCRRGGAVPPGFVVTLPKVEAEDQVRALVELLGRLEERLDLPDRALRLELMIESPRAIVAPDGALMPPRLLAAAQGRCAAAHFGTYDYTASCDVTAAHQAMAHPACDFAKHVMQVCFAGTGVTLSDGATTRLPVPPHRGEGLDPQRVAENRAVVHAAWRAHDRDARRSLAGGFYQGWDLHPGQLPTRYAAVYSFFHEGLEPASRRLSSFVARAAQATLSGDRFDDAATGQGLLNYFLRAVSCGALTEAEASARSGLSAEELRTRSFLRVVEGRRG